MDKIDNIPVFESEQEASEYATRIGCKGYHPHEHEGKTVYMPCEEHGKVLDAIEDAGESLEDMLDDYEIVQIRVVDDPESVSERYLKRLRHCPEIRDRTAVKN